MWKDEADGRRSRKTYLLYFCHSIYFSFQCRRRRCLCCCCFFPLCTRLLRVFFSYAFFCSTWICYSANWNTCHNGMFSIFLVVLCALADRKRQLYWVCMCCSWWFRLCSNLKVYHVDSIFISFKSQNPQNDTKSQFAWLNFAPRCEHSTYIIYWLCNLYFSGINQIYAIKMNDPQIKPSNKPKVKEAKKNQRKHRWPKNTSIDTPKNVPNDIFDHFLRYIVNF